MFVVALAVALSLATIAGWFGTPVLRSRSGSLALLVLAGGTGYGLVRWLRPQVERMGRRMSLTIALPACAVLGVALVGLLRGTPWGLEWFLNGDHPRHAVYVADTWVQGNLTYADESYPRGWHSVLAALWSVFGAGLDGIHVARLLTLMAASSLVLSATLALATAELGLALATVADFRQRSAAGIGLSAGALTLLNFALANYQALGYENSILAAAVLAVCAREALVRPGSKVSLVVCGAGTVVVAHAWQLLLPAVAAAAIWCAVCAFREHERWTRLGLAALTIATLVLGAPSVRAVIAEVGLNHATAEGPDSPVPVGLLAVGLASAGLFASRRREGRTTSLMLITVLPALIAVGLAAAMRLDLTHYYPSKLLWQSTVLSLPWTVVVAAWLLKAASVRWPSIDRPLHGAGNVIAATVTAFALTLPLGSQLGTWSTVPGDRVLGAVTAPGASEAVVVWLQDTSTADSVTRSLLDTLRVAQTRARAPQARLSVAQECLLLRTAARPVVLSTARNPEVRKRYACAPNVVVLPAAPLR